MEITTAIVLVDTRKREVLKAIKKLRPQLENFIKICGWYKNTSEIEHKILPVNYAITFGGDGLLLAAARELASYDIPVIGINFGKLGFLTELTIAEFSEELPRLLQKPHQIVPRMMLQCQVQRDDKIVYSSFALNDSVIKCKNVSRTLYMKICIDKEEITNFGGDGVIVATPVGSTAYSLSSGGPILAPSLSALMITPICPHVITLRPMVISSQSNIEVSLIAPYPVGAVLTIDGQVNFDLEKKDRVLISRAPRDFFLVDTKRRSFFRILREKLIWGEARLRFTQEK